MNNTYALNIAEDKKSWSLVINDKTVLTGQTRLIHKPLIAKLFSENGYGKPMVVNDKTIYCPCEGSDETIEVCRRLVKAGFLP
jgi:hypothetical protein